MYKLFFFLILSSLFINFPSFFINAMETYNNVLHFSLSNEDELNMFYEFIEKFNKNYRSFTELEERFNIFSKNLRSILLHNQDTKQNFTMGINQFSDLTSEEFKNIYISSTDDIGVCGIAAEPSFISV